MIKQALLCATFLASGFGGIAAADRLDQPPALAETRITDFTHVFEGGAWQHVPALLSDISAWLAANFDLTATSDMPRVEFVSPQRITMLRYRLMPMLSGASPGPAPLGEGRAVLAVYEDRTQTIYLPESWRGESPAEQSILVHEMVHHLQNRARLKFNCPQEREKLAYQAQEQWLAQFGGSLEREFEIDPLTLLVHVNCMM